MTTRKLPIGAELTDQELQAKTAAFLDGLVPPFRATVTNKTKKMLVLLEFPGSAVAAGESLEATFTDADVLHRCIHDAAHVAKAKKNELLVEFAVEVPKAKTAENSEAKA